MCSNCRILRNGKQRSWSRMSANEAKKKMMCSLGLLSSFLFLLSFFLSFLPFCFLSSFFLSFFLCLEEEREKRSLKG